MVYRCESCNLTLKSEVNLCRHQLTARHKNRLDKKKHMHICNCGKKYIHSSSYYRHKKQCQENTLAIQNIQDQVNELRNTLEEERRQHKKERDEWRAQIALLLENKEKNTTNHIERQHIENQQNIHIHINPFGNENLDYIDDDTYFRCINRVCNSIPAILEKIHFDPEHPENHNVKITNKKLPYASIMDSNSKWKTVLKNDALDSMVYNGFNILDDKYAEFKELIAEPKQLRFEEFQKKLENQDKELLKTIKTNIELLLLNR
jgi:hypothetical protein